MGEIPHAQYNSKSPAVKRILSELKRMQQHKDEEFTAQPLADNLFEWHFTIRGAADSDYACGLYHGRILLPAEYPFKAPSVIFMTESGRFECNRKICLSITSFHEDTWSASWDLRTAIIALIAFMPTAAEGAIGGLDVPSAERRRLAQLSRQYKCPVCCKSNSDMFGHSHGQSLSEVKTVEDVVITAPVEARNRVVLNGDGQSRVHSAQVEIRPRVAVQQQQQANIWLDRVLFAILVALAVLLVRRLS